MCAEWRGERFYTEPDSGSGNQYNPEVMDAFKVNVMPEVEEPAAPKQAINYATDLRPLGAWKTTPMEAMSRELAQKRADRGYVRAAYGTLNNVDLKGSYLWDISSKDRLGIMASLYGLNGEIPHFMEGEEWKSRFTVRMCRWTTGMISGRWR